MTFETSRIRPENSLTEAEVKERFLGFIFLLKSIWTPLRLTLVNFELANNDGKLNIDCVSILLTNYPLKLHRFGIIRPSKIYSYNLQNDTFENESTLFAPYTNCRCFVAKFPVEYKNDRKRQTKE